MATVVPAPAGTSNIAQNFALAGGQLGQGLGQLLARRRQQELLQQQGQARQQFAGQLGLNLPPGLSPELGQQLITQQFQQQFAQPNLTQASSVIRDPDNPNRAIRVRDTFNEQGVLVNRIVLGEATLAEAIGGVAEAGLTGGTTSQIEKDVVELQATLGELEAVNQQFNPDFFTFRGKGKAFFTAQAEKLEIPVSQASKEFLSNRSKFFADSKRVFLKFRKFITGVAGGIEEFREIAKATIDPEKDSPTQFTAKMSSMRDNATRVSNMLLAIRNSGLDPRNKKNIADITKQVKLEDVPLEVNPNITIEGLISGAADTTIPSRAALGVSLSSPQTQAQFDAIPVGAEFIDTDGTRKVKQ